MGTQPIEAILAEHALSMLRPLTDAAGDAGARRRLWSGIGWTPAALAGADPEQLVAAFEVCRSTVEELTERLTEGIETLGDAIACLARIRAAVGAVTAAVDGWRPPSTDPAPYRLLLADLFAHLLDAHLTLRAPTLLAFCDVVGVRRLVPGTPLEVDGVVARDGRARPVYDLAPLAALLRDPVATVRERVFGPAVPPGLPDALADTLGPLIAGWLSDLGVLAAYGTPGAQSPESGLSEAERAAAAHLLHVAWRGGEGPVAAEFHLAAGLIRDIPEGGTDGPLAAVLAPRGELSATVEDGPWRLDATVAGASRPVVVSRDGARFEPPDQAGALSGEVVLRYGDASGGLPVLRLGGADAIRLEIAEIRLGGTATVDSSGPTGEVAASLLGTRLVLEPGGDGFLASILPKQPVVVDLDLGLAWSPTTGLTFSGGARLDQTFPVGRTLGPLTIQQVRVVLGGTTDGEVQLRVTADMTVRLGPVTAAVADLGLRAALRPATGPGAFGPFDLVLEPVTPTGIGIAVDASVVTGGGYLFADPATGDYGGAVELKFASLQLSAIGLLSTRMPDGSPGFSLLVLISARFPAVQLGFGFSLTGVGGLIGIHRSVQVDAVRAGLESGALDRILFPSDVVGNAQQVVRDLARYFPTTVGQFVVGPTVELSWGAQSVLTARLGLFVEFPNPTRVVLAGQLRLALPPGAEKPIVLIQVDVLGALDFDRRTLAIDGVIRDSRIATMTLSGGLAVRAGWGDDPAFLVSLGGFNPRFKPPDRFPVPRRLTLSLGESDNPRLRLSAYLALTSNTVQFGARLDLYASVSIPIVGTFSISALLGFDALVTLDPLRLVVDIYAGVALLWDGDPVLAVYLEFTLTGPSPWHAVGTATFKFLGTHRIHFDVTVGKRAVQPPPAQVDLGARLRAALEKVESWSATLPEATGAAVTLAEHAAAPGTITVHPLGSLTVTQQVAPLNLRLDRYGSARLTGVRPPFTLRVTLDGQDAETQPVRGDFAQGEYLDLTEAERLSWPSFASWEAGARIDDSALLMPPSPARTVSARYEQWRLRPDGSAAPAGATDLPDERMRLQVGAGAAAVNGVWAQGARAFAGPAIGVAVASPTYAVVRVAPPSTGVIATLEPEQIMVDSYAAAREALRAASAAGVRRLRLVDNDEVPAG